MIKRPMSAREWTTDETRSRERDRMEQELATAVERSVNSLRCKLQELVRREQGEEAVQ
jgi:hypothetical protein